MKERDGDAARESVWDYPRPPRVEACRAHLKVDFNGETVADTRNGYRLLETSHPPVYYIPLSDIRTELLRPGSGSSFCEFKGSARYWDIHAGGKTAPAAAWSYPSPAPAYAALRDHVAFYAQRVDNCFVDGERVQPQPGDFYGGWITSKVEGPFKGGPGTRGW